MADNFQSMSRLKRLGLVLVGAILFLFALVGVLTMTRGTQVRRVIARGDQGAPPPATD